MATHLSGTENQRHRSACDGNETILRRHIGVDPIPATSWATAVFASRTPSESRSPEQNDALTLAATLTDELAIADALLFAVPLYNFGVSQHFKAYVDMVTTDPRMAAGAQPILAGKPAILVTVRGGSMIRFRESHHRPWLIARRLCGVPVRDGGGRGVAALIGMRAI